MSEPGEITIVAVESESFSTRRGPGGDALRRVVEAGVRVDRLGESLARFLDSIAALLEAHEARGGPFELAEVGFSAEIGADGEFKLLGAGAGVTASSGVTLTWRRRPPPEGDAGLAG
jgi:hypothetical protein